MSVTQRGLEGDGTTYNRQFETRYGLSLNELLSSFSWKRLFPQGFLLYYFFKSESCTENVLTLYKKILLFLQILFKYHFVNTARSIYTLISTLLSSEKKTHTKTTTKEGQGWILIIVFQNNVLKVGSLVISCGRMSKTWLSSLTSSDYWTHMEKFLFISRSNWNNLKYNLKYFSWEMTICLDPSITFLSD